MYSNNRFLDYVLIEFILFLMYVALKQTATGPSIICSGSDITLRCVILLNGRSEPAVWMRNGSTIVPSNHQSVYNPTVGAFTDLLITNVGLNDDNTEYQCTAIGSNINSSLLLDVTGQCILHELVK